MATKQTDPPDEMRDSAPPPPAAPRRIFIDALNVAYWCGTPPSLRFPLALLTHLLAHGHETILYFDASARHRLGDEAGLYALLMRLPGLAVEVPSGRSADRGMLRQATSAGGCVISRDRYRDHRTRYRKLIDDPNRLIPGTVAEDRLRLPLLSLDVPLPASTQEAYAQLQLLMASRDRRSPEQTVPHVSPARLPSISGQ